MRQWIAIGAAVGLVAVTLPMLRKHDVELAGLLAKSKIETNGGPVVTREVTPPPLTDVDLTRIDDRGNVAIAPAHGNRRAELTVVPKYQRAAMAFMRQGRVPEGAVVMTDIKTGKVLAWASYVDQGALHDVAAEATAPSASVFKIVTATALVEQAGLGPNTKQCYSGGEHSITARDLVDNKKRDKWCATLAQAMGRSLNTVFARLASRNLDRGALEGTAQKLGWGQDIPFDVKLAQSTISLPEDELGFARTAAGFWNTTLSPFQAANLATTVANGGEMIRLSIVDNVKDEDGEIYRGPTARLPLKRVMSEQTAQAITTMMEQTVESGTSYKSFHDRAGRAYLPNIRIAGKTGTLTKPTPEGPFYTWWVGFAPSDKPEIALSVLVANGAKWRVKATNVASDMLRVYFADKDAPGVRSPFDTGSRARR
ncbi:penicillin-binding transpeptidase domain-containing protein [Polyangium spumosum]|uniref:Penicillin-binding protein n=1 Tax=Polyangium spumosum TaxID=889282 RepID=A0A6N7PRA0_9BACT|nr:penicillin-binding transpeptidase domain-containing protein [Polyangium spumosum]MRG94513.1 penicillin-binding protein [Polyangium spumosum]